MDPLPDLPKAHRIVNRSHLLLRCRPRIDFFAPVVPFGEAVFEDPKGQQDAAGLTGYGFTFHALRHTFATTLLRQNVNPKIVQHQLGHATISQTMDTYSHVMPDMSDIAAEALEAALS